MVGKDLVVKNPISQTYFNVSLCVQSQSQLLITFTMVPETSVIVK
jgi:hypothetical protein